MARPEVRVFESISDLDHEAARRALEVLQTTREGRDVRMALSGGSTPARFHGLLAAAEGIDWSRVHVYWGDERTVAPTDSESNYRMARETLLDKVAIPERQIHRMQGELVPELAASEYEQVLRTTFGVEWPDLPQLDLTILGIGADGHTASLFPGTAALTEFEKWVVANEVPQLNTWRITLTYPILNASKRTLVLVNGDSKAEAVRDIFDPNSQNKPPAALVRPTGEIVWLLDTAAAQYLD